MKLSDFNVGQPDSGLSPAIKDFNNPKPVTSGANTGTINNLAAHASVLGGSETLLQTYSSITNELNSGTNSATLDKMLTEQSEFDYASNLESLRQVLADPNVTDDDKARYTQGFANLTAEPLGGKSVSIAVGRMAQMADSDPSDNDETEFTRINSDMSLDEVDSYNGWVQDQINAQQKLSDPSGLATVTNIIEMMIPFMEQAAVAETRANLEGGNVGNIMQSLALLGESKNSVREALMKMPPAQRKDLATKVVEYVKMGKGSISIRPNDILIMSQLNDYLVTGSYGSGNRFIDNLFSALDVAVFLKPLKALGKFGKSVSATAATRRAAAANAKIAEAVPDVEEIIDTIAPIPVAPLDNIIDGIIGFDKATSEEIADARNTIGRGLEEGLDIEEIISNTKAFDKFTADEINQARQVIGTPAAHTTPPLSQGVVDETGQLIADRIIDRLSELDEAPYQVYQDIRKAVGTEVTNVSLTNPKGLSKTVIKKVNDVLNQHGITAIKGDTLKGLRKQIEAESSVSRRSVRTDVAPTSLSQTFKETNPGKARSAFKAVVDDETGQLAEVIYGTNRTEVIANDVLPEITELGGTVRNKVEMPDPDQDIIKTLQEAKGFSEFSEFEKANMRNTVIQDFKNVIGLTPRRAMNAIGDTDNGVKIDQIYGPTDGGFRSPREALQKAKLAFAKYGITDKELEVVARQPNGEYAPATKMDDGNYLVRVKYDYEFSPADTIAWTTTSTNRFWRMFDAVLPWEKGGTGGVAQHLIPHTAIQDKLLINAASVSSDRMAWINKKMLELAGDYAQKFNKLDGRQKALVSNYIVEANNLSIPFNPINLKARGLSDNSIETVRSWKKAWDTHWYFENQDVNKTLRAKGYYQFVDDTNNTGFVIKPIGPVKLTGEYDVDKAMTAVFRILGTDKVKVYDSSLNKIVTLNRPDIVDLYSKGGQLGQTRRAVSIGEDSVEYVVVRGNEESYIRRIRDDDATLNYRDGHYTVYYNQPYFITKEIMVDGKVMTKAVASAGSVKDAARLRDNLQLTDEAGVYNVRGDLKAGTVDFDDYQWDTMVSGGRTSQRVRGQRLVNGSGQQTDLNHVHMESPEESLIHSIRSMSSRVAHRDYIDAAKARFMNQFNDLLPEVKGQRQWPDDVRLIGKGDPTIPRSRVKDATNTWRYIEAIDSGYVNLLDDMSKNLFKGFSEMAGRSGWGWLETGLQKASDVNPTAWARKKAFRFLLAANPLRQAPVQAMQALPIVLALNPKMLLTGRLPAQFLFINYLNRGGDVDSFFKAAAKLATGLTPAEAKKLAHDYEISGFEAAVKANSLIRDDLKRLVDRNVFSRMSSFAAMPLNIAQRVGFEAGENALMRTVWLSEYDILRQAKTNITPAVLEQLNARVRNLTLNMNKAGELPYNENAFSALMQFFQAPHKAFAQIVMGHQGLSGWDRIKLGTSYVLTYGVGGGYVLDFVNKQLHTDDKTRSVIEGGFFNLLMNKALTSLYGQETAVDFSDSLRLLQVPDMFKFAQTIWGMEFGAALTASPSASLVMGDNPRITRFVKQLMIPFTVDNDRKPQEIMNTAKTFLSIFSGMSNFYKAQYILDHQKSMSSSGKIPDFHVNDFEALMKAAGFSTIDEIHQYAFDEKSYKISETFKKDVTEFVNEMGYRLAVEGISNDETEYWLRIMGDAQRVWNNDPFYMKEIQSQLFYKATRGEYDIYKAVLRLSGLSDEATLKDLISTAPISSEEKAKLNTMIENIKGAQ